MKKIVFLIAVLAMFAPAVNAQKIKETHRFAIKGSDTLFVDRHIDNSKIKSDLMPTMIYMYGGGWAFGGRGGDFSYLTDIGVQVISIDYRKGLTKYGYNPAPPEEMEKAIDMALDDLTDAMAFVLSRADEWKVDKVMLSGSSAGGITTLLSIYDICNDGPYSKKFPEGCI
jgi:acetyl esterase/lipase